MAGCCGGGPAKAPPDPNRGVTGRWSIRWPHGPLQTFPDEDAARAFAAKFPSKHLVVLEPVSYEGSEG